MFETCLKPPKQVSMRSDRDSDQIAHTICVNTSRSSKAVGFQLLGGQLLVARVKLLHWTGQPSFNLEEQIQVRSLINTCAAFSTFDLQHSTFKTKPWNK